MPQGIVTILGGLPVIAEVWFTRGDGYTTDDDAGVNALYWIKRDGTKGKPLSQKIWDRLEKSNPYWQADVTLVVSEQLAWEADQQRESSRDEMVPFTLKALETGHE